MKINLLSRTRVGFFFASLLAAQLFCAESFAADSRGSSAELSRLKTLVKSLSDRIEDLEKREQVRVDEVELQALEREVEQAAALFDYPNLSIGGFYDFNFRASENERLAQGSGFTKGQFVLHFNSQISDNFSFFGETTLTATSNSTYRTAVERAILKYEYSDWLKISGGRYHTPINWWNVAYHHGQWLQSTVARPEMTKFGGKFLPVHYVGTIVEGGHPLGGVNFYYEAGIGNGRFDPIQAGGDGGDINNSRAFVGKVYARPDGVEGLEVGASVYVDEVTLKKDGGPDVESDELILAGHLVLISERNELIAEFANVEHEGDNNPAYYVQVGHRLPFFKEMIKPYFRWEEIEIDEDDPIFNDPSVNVEDFKLAIAGLRFDVAELVALKAEYRNGKIGNDDSFNAAYFQAAFAF